MSFLDRCKALIIVCLASIPFVSNAQDESLAKYVQSSSIIKEGGTELFSYKGQNFMISVASVIVGTKNEIDCKKVGQAKAKRDMIAYVNGSEIASYTELKIIENTTENIEGTKIHSSQEYAEVIKEEVLGMINQCTELCGWYSDDRSVYYYALYKTVQ